MMTVLKAWSGRFKRYLETCGIKEKLIAIFVVIKVLPVILLAWTAGDQVLTLGTAVEQRSAAMVNATRDKVQEIGDIAVKSSVTALDRRSREAIEQLTTDTAHEVAAFLYDRDREVRFAATLVPSESEYRRFLAHRIRPVVEHGPWALDAKGEKWRPIDAPASGGPEVKTRVKDNEKEWHYRAPERRGTTVDRPLYLEMTFIDLKGNEKVKVATSGLLPSGLRNVARRENTYCKAETYFSELQKLKPGQIAVSEVIGPYVGTPLIGAYTPVRAKEKGVVYAPEQAGYAGKENPVGKRFRGLIRWGTPVVQEGRITGYVTLALDHRHLKEFTDHIVPTEERFTEIPDAASGNYAFIWDYQGRSIVHPRDHSIVGYDPATGEPAVPWLDTELYAQWRASGLPIRAFLAKAPQFHQPSLTKKPAPELTKNGFVGLDGRYLNFAPQCAGWHELTSQGGSGSFVIFWSGLWKLTTAAAIPYYTGRYGGHPRGFGYVTIGANVDEFHLPATESARRINELVASFVGDINLKQKATHDLIHGSVSATTRNLTILTLVMVIMVIIIAVWMAGFLTSRITQMIGGIRSFQEGNFSTRLEIRSHDEMGSLAEAFNNMAGTLQSREEALRTSEEKYRRLIEQAREGVLALDRDGVITFANPYLAEILGYHLDELRGQLLYAFIHENDAPYLKEKLRQRREGVSEQYELEMVRKDGQIISVSISGSPMIDDAGSFMGSFGVVMDITERKRAAEQIRESLQEKEVLLKEIHHRVKNNMQVISSLLNLQSRYIKDPETLEKFRESQERVKSMALIHEKLYSSGNLGQIPFCEYVKTLVKSIVHSYAVSPDVASVTVTADHEIMFGVDTAIPCGLILNELIANALKHAFPDGRKGTVTVGVSRGDDGFITLSVADNGVGLPLGLDVAKVDSLGLRLVSMLTRQLRGVLEIGQEGQGSCFRIRFRDNDEKG